MVRGNIFSYKSHKHFSFTIRTKYGVPKNAVQFREAVLYRPEVQPKTYVEGYSEQGTDLKLSSSGGLSGGETNDTSSPVVSDAKKRKKIYFYARCGFIYCVLFVTSQVKRLDLQAKIYRKRYFVPFIACEVFTSL